MMSCPQYGTMGRIRKPGVEAERLPLQFKLTHYPSRAINARSGTVSDLVS
jgi:hypothetical protein